MPSPLCHDLPEHVQADTGRFQSGQSTVRRCRSCANTAQRCAIGLTPTVAIWSCARSATSTRTTASPSHTRCSVTGRRSSIRSPARVSRTSNTMEPPRPRRTIRSDGGQRRLLAALATAGGAPVRAELLGEMLDLGGSALRTAVSRLRARIGDDGIATDGSGHRLDVAVDA